MAFSGGQETLQYYTGFGLAGLAGIALTMVLCGAFAWYVQAVTCREKETLTEPSDIMLFLMGPKLGKVFTALLMAALFTGSITRVSGAGALIEEYFGLPNRIGRLGLLLAMGITILLGLEKIVNVMEVIGPVVIVCTFIVMIASIAGGQVSLLEGAHAAQQMDFTKGGPNFALSAVIYSGNIMITIIPIWVINGRMSRNLKEAKVSALTGMAAVLAAFLVIFAAQTMNISIVGGTQQPNLVLAGVYLPLFSVLFAAVLMAGNYASTTAECWYVVRQFTKEKTKAYRILTVVLCAVLYVITGLIPFDRLLKVVFAAVFGIGLICFAVMIVRTVMKYIGRDTDEIYLDRIRQMRRPACGSDHKNSAL